MLEDDSSAENAADLSQAGAGSSQGVIADCSIVVKAPEAAEKAVVAEVQRKLDEARQIWTARAHRDAVRALLLGVLELLEEP